MALSILPNQIVDATNNVFRYLLDADLQHKCHFEFTILRNPFAGFSGQVGGGSGIAAGINAAVGTAGLAADVLVTKFFLESIEFPLGINLEYNDYNGRKRVENIVHPEEVTLRFIETEGAVVLRYFTQWRNEIVVPETTKMGQSLTDSLVASLPFASMFTGNEGGYVFRDNQKAAKRTGMLLIKPKSGQVELTNFPRILFHGLMFKSLSNQNVGQGATENMTWDITLSVEDIKVPLLF